MENDIEYRRFISAIKEGTSALAESGEGTERTVRAVAAKTSGHRRAKKFGTLGKALISTGLSAAAMIAAAVMFSAQGDRPGQDGAESDGMVQARAGQESAAPDKGKEYRLYTAYLNSRALKDGLMQKIQAENHTDHNSK